MKNAVIGFAWLAALALTGTAFAAQGQQQNGPQPNRQREKQGAGLFPGNEKVPMYSTSANNTGATLRGGGADPNAGSTGLTGSGSNSYGWSAPAYSSPTTTPR
jgi:hypothetical protein